MSTSAFGDGLDMSNLDSITPEEVTRFREYYDRVKGGLIPAHEFLLTNRPDLLKRHRAIAREMTDLDNELHPLCHTLTHLHYYTTTGFRAGIWYEARQGWAGGATRGDVLDTIGIAYLHAGPMRMDDVAAALTDYMKSWVDPEPVDRFPPHWKFDKEILRSGLRFETPEVLPGEMAALQGWYEQAIGEVPDYIRFMAAERPRMLKAFRNRLENAIKESLPVQAIPYFLIHHAVANNWTANLREWILLGRHLGLKRSELLDAISWATFYGGPSGMALASTFGEILDD